MTDADEADDDAVPALEALGTEPSPDFYRRLRGSIERRVLGAQMLEMGMESLAAVALEYLALLMSAGEVRQERGERHD